MYAIFRKEKNYSRRFRREKASPANPLPSNKRLLGSGLETFLTVPLVPGSGAISPLEFPVLIEALGPSETLEMPKPPEPLLEDSPLPEPEREKLRAPGAIPLLPSPVKEENEEEPPPEPEPPLPPPPPRQPERKKVATIPRREGYVNRMESGGTPGGLIRPAGGRRRMVKRKFLNLPAPRDAAEKADQSKTEQRHAGRFWNRCKEHGIRQPVNRVVAAVVVVHETLQ